MQSHIQQHFSAQKKDAPTAASILDASSQSESLQRKADMANNAAQREEAPRPNNTGMPDNLKAGIESLSGFSMDDVRVHYNSSKPATVQALAYTQGTDIHVAPGQEKHLPHEAWHVAQQMAGRVSPTTNINGMPVNDNAALEHEADVMGEKAVTQKQTKNIQNNTDSTSKIAQRKKHPSRNSANSVIQCVTSTTGDSQPQNYAKCNRKRAMAFFNTINYSRFAGRMRNNLVSNQHFHLDFQQNFQRNGLTYLNYQVQLTQHGISTIASVTVCDSIVGNIDGIFRAALITSFNEKATVEINP
nr:DUF4157 domain-containing protein [uncultured Fibrobacter sp.]